MSASAQRGKTHAAEENTMKRHVALCMLMCGCAGAPSSDPSGPAHRPISGPTPTVVVLRVSPSDQPRHDTAYSRAEARCLEIWARLGYAVDLHETPEHDWGVQCVLQGYDGGMCVQVGGHTAELPCANDGGSLCATCLVDVRYDELE